LGTGHCAHFCCPFWKFWLGQIPHGHNKFQPNFEVDIYGATSMLLTTKNLDDGQVSEEPKKNKNKHKYLRRTVKIMKTIMLWNVVDTSHLCPFFCVFGNFGLP